MTIILGVLLVKGGGVGRGVTPLNTNSNKQFYRLTSIENNLLKDQNISLIVIFMIILITFPFDDVVMLLGENCCWSLKRERGLIREVPLGKEGWLINQVSHLICTPPRRATPPDSP